MHVIQSKFTRSNPQQISNLRRVRCAGPGSAFDSIYIYMYINLPSATPVHVQIHFNLISPITTINLRCMHFYSNSLILILCWKWGFKFVSHPYPHFLGVLSRTLSPTFGSYPHFLRFCLAPYPHFLGFCLAPYPHFWGFCLAPYPHSPLKSGFMFLIVLGVYKYHVSTLNASMQGVINYSKALLNIDLMHL